MERIETIRANRIIVFLSENILKNLRKMAQKRASDALVAMPDMKRSRNELVAITNRDKALLEAVSKMGEL